MILALVSNYLVVCACLFQCAVCGFALQRLMLGKDSGNNPNYNQYLYWFFAISLGISVNILTFFVLLVTGIFYKTVVLGVSLGLLFISIIYLYWCGFNIGLNIKSWRISHAALLALLLGTTLLFAMHPPGFWDDTSFHLPVAKSYWEHHGLALNENLRYPLFPQNIDILFSIGLFNGNILLAQSFAAVPLFIVIVGVIGTSLWLTNSFALGVAMGVSLFVVNPFGGTFGYAYIDCGFLLFCWAATLAVAIAGEMEAGQRKSWFIIAGILVGCAIGSKLFGLVFAAIIGSYILIIQRDWRSSVFFGGTAFFVGVGWYLRSFLISGDPINPLGGNIFGFYLWDATDLLNLKSEQSSFGVAVLTFNIPLAFIKAGVSLWILVLISLLIRELSRPIRYFQYVFTSYILFWFFVTQVERYLVPVAAIAVFLVWYLIWLFYPMSWVKKLLDISPHWLSKSLPIAILFVASSFIAYVKYNESNFMVSNWKAVLSSHEGVDLFIEANTLIPQYGPTLVHLGFENGTYFFDGLAIGDWFGPGRYRSMLDCLDAQCKVKPPQEIKFLLEKFNSRIFIVSTLMFPQIDIPEYQKYFDIIKVDTNGVLMVIKGVADSSSP